MIGPYYKDESCTLYCGDSAVVLKELPDRCIDLTVTSPPYDNLRTYNGYVFDFETIARELYRITKDGGIVVWIVGDATIEGSETGTSFKQVLGFMGTGFRLHDTMIYKKSNFSHPEKTRYHSVFEYMFILSKGSPNTFNPIKDKINTWAGTGPLGRNTMREKSGKMTERKKNIISEFGMRTNVWEMNTPGQENMCEAIEHPATFTEQMANDHIISWSNKGDMILDCFHGSGTTWKACKILKRRYIGIEISQEYCDLSIRRINKPIPLFESLATCNNQKEE